jgi:hypothetical protein
MARATTSKQGVDSEYILDRINCVTELNLGRLVGGPAWLGFGLDRCQHDPDF